MRFLTTTLTALAACAVIATAADEPKKADKPKADPEAAFKKLDTNGDNFLSLDEFKASPRFKKDPSTAEAAFKAKDKDSDGKLSLDEFKAHGPGHGKKKENK